MKFQLPSFNTRQLLILTHDLGATALALITSFFLRFDASGLVERLPGLVLVLPGFLVIAGVVYHFTRLHRAKWRFASLPDLDNIVRASTILALVLLVVDYILVAPNILGTFFFGKLTIIVYWVLQMFFLGGPRMAYRYFRYRRDRNRAKTAGSMPALILGRAADVEVLLRSIESGAVKKIAPAGVLSPSPADRNQLVRGIAVLGGFDEFEQVISDLAGRGQAIMRVVLTPSALDPELHPETVIMKARRLGLATQRLPSLDEGSDALQLAPVNVEDLLLRPSVAIDHQRLERFVSGKSIVVTGGGCSIGAEICHRIVTFGAARVMIVENSEPALYAVLEALETKRSKAEITGKLADVRDRDRIFRLIRDFKPEIIFHAAALKHVPLIEENWEEGVKTNVFGSVNVADAAVSAGASAMVMVSTDKAIEPVSVLGASKRFAEMYCQALDGDRLRQEGKGRMRLIAVRFGNVLASNGSVVPKFKAQIEAGGPVTVTHPDMVRYFMTIREACDLVVTAATHAVNGDRSDVSVYVLNMGQPVKIIDLAERMIRLSGLEPGRDIDITFVGVRPGERLQEILFAREEPTMPIGIEGLVAARPLSPSLPSMRAWLAALEQGIAREDRSVVYKVLGEAVPDFRGVAAA
jgi:FlaA1/EpsC-like NDP-sugar epimerase